MLVSQWQANGSGGFQYADITSSILANTAYVATNLVDGTEVPYHAFGNTTYIKNQFVEMSVDLTALLGALADPCSGIQIKTVMVKTKTSTTDNATLEDLVDLVGRQPAALEQVPRQGARLGEGVPQGGAFVELGGG